MRPVGMVEPGVEPVAALLALGQMLEQQSSRDSSPSRFSAASRTMLGICSDWAKKLSAASARLSPVERDDPLIALVHPRMVEGDRQIAFAEQGEERRARPRLRQPRRIVADIAAKLAAQIVADQKVDRPALVWAWRVICPSGSLSIAPSSAVSASASASSRSIDRRIIVIGEDRIEHRAEASDPPARIAPRNGHAQCDVGAQLVLEAWR
jgi:hypothetical protein